MRVAQGFSPDIGPKVLIPQVDADAKQHHSWWIVRPTGYYSTLLWSPQDAGRTNELQRWHKIGLLWCLCCVVSS